MVIPAQSATARPASVETVAPRPPQPPTGTSAAATPVVVSEPPPGEYGGNSSGRALRRFKHPPDTPEGQAERRAADAERKRRQRQLKEPEPPALPSAAPRPDQTEMPSAAPALDRGAVPSSSTLSVEPEPLPWQADTLKDLIGELLDAAEQNRVAQFLEKCREAGLVGQLIKEVERDAYFPKTAKLLLKNALPRLAAKYLNKAGFSAEYRDELACVTAVLLIIKHDRSLSQRLDEMIALKREEEARARAPTHSSPP